MISGAHRREGNWEAGSDDMKGVESQMRMKAIKRESRWQVRLSGKAAQRGSAPEAWQAKPSRMCKVIHHTQACYSKTQPSHAPEVLPLEKTAAGRGAFQCSGMMAFRQDKLGQHGM